MNTLTMRAGTCEYPVYIEKGLLPSVPERLKEVFPKSRFAIITDDNVNALYGKSVTASFEAAGLRHDLLSVKPGEGAKSIDVFSRLLSELAQRGYNRADVIVALGGGVVGDLSGFVAAVFLRGLRCVQVPTTLLAQIDSAVGGKTAINLPEGKNLVGAFHQPSAVFVDTSLLQTLPEADFADGMSELIKYALIRDADMFTELEQNSAIHADSDILASWITKCLSIKRDVVAADEKDTGERMLLNFGHTIGHGIERICAAQKRPMTHGRAVAIGMAAITAASEHMGLTKAGTAQRIIAVLKKMGLPYDISAYDKEEILKGILVDKKNVADKLNLVLISGPGQSFLHRIPGSDAKSYI
jgi:3-dehydroquinate synthase